MFYGLAKNISQDFNTPLPTVLPTADNKKAPPIGEAQHIHCTS
jgi:hypothetical protein